MPPAPAQRARPSGGDKYVTAFERTHPVMQRLLLSACQTSTPLLIATALATAGVLKRPRWERNFLWRAAVAAFLSRWVLVTCAITWTLNDWGGEMDPDAGVGEGEGEAAAH